MLISAKYSFVAGTGEQRAAGRAGMRPREVFFKPTAKRWGEEKKNGMGRSGGGEISGGWNRSCEVDPGSAAVFNSR